jgi:hypothetical protein
MTIYGSIYVCATMLVRYSLCHEIFVRLKLKIFNGRCLTVVKYEMPLALSSKHNYEDQATTEKHDTFVPLYTQSWIT